MYRFFISIIFYSVLTISSFSQNTISGNVESVPEKIPAYARLTFTDIADTLQKHIAYTDSLNGNYSLIVPNGMYKRKVEVQGHFLYLDEITIMLKLESYF